MRKRFRKVNSLTHSTLGSPVCSDWQTMGNTEKISMREFAEREGSSVRNSSTFPLANTLVPTENRCRKIDYSLQMQQTTTNCRKFITDSLKAKRNLITTDKLLPKLRNKSKPNKIISQRLKTSDQLNQLTSVKSMLLILYLSASQYAYTNAQIFDPTTTSGSPPLSASDSNNQPATTAATCFGGLQTFEKISMSTFENPSSSSGSGGGSFGSGILVQQDDQALTSECVNLCRSQSNCLSFVIDYNKFECKSYATTQQELQQEFDEKYQAARSVNNSTLGNATDPSGGYQASASNIHFQHLLPSASSNYFEKICLDGVANRNQFGDVCGQGRLWTIERVVDSFLDGYVEKEVTNVNNKDECGKLCIFEAQFVCRSADYDQHSRLCRLSKEDRRTQPQAMRTVSGSNRQYLENQCATPGPSSCVYETKKNTGIISMDALKFAQTIQDCQMKCNQELTFNCRSYSFHQQRCFLSGDDSSSLNSNLIKLPTKQGWQYGEKKCLVELCTKGIFSYEKITGYTLRSSLSTPIDLMLPGGSSLSLAVMGNNLDDLEKPQHDSSNTKLRHLLPMHHVPRPASNNMSNIVSTMMMMMNGGGGGSSSVPSEPLYESESSARQQRGASNLAITNHCRHSCDLGYLNCPAFTIDYKNNRCQRLDRNSQGRHHELVARDGFAYYEKICLRVPEIMSMCQDKYWIFERVIGYELAPRMYDKSLKFVQSRRDCEEYCLEEKQFQCRSALYNDEVFECKLSRFDRRLANQEGGYQRNFNSRISYLENQCVRDHGADKRQQCSYEQARDEPAYPTFTEHIEMVPTSNNPVSSIETESTSNLQEPSPNSTTSPRYGHSYCEQLCNDNAKFECHSFGYYASTAQCFLSGDDSISAGESATTPSTGFTYFEKRCRLAPNSMHVNYTSGVDDSSRGSQTNGGGTTSMPEHHDTGTYFRPPGHKNNFNVPNITSVIDINLPATSKPSILNNNISIHIDQQVNLARPHKNRPFESSNDTSVDADQYKCGQGHTFVYQRISGFEPIGGYLTLLVRNNEQPGIVSDCAELCKKAYECRAFVVDYNSNQCFAMLENSSVGLLSLRQALGKDYFEGFCLANHILLSGSNCKEKTWVMDKIVDQAVVGVQHQKLIPDIDRLQCRQACLDERLFWCKSAMFDGSTGECKLYSLDRESVLQMRLLFTKGVDFFENQCQITSSSCPYDAIERDMTIVTTTKSVQARSTFDCEHACNSEVTFNCRSYTYMDQYPSLPNLCLLSSDSRSTSQRGSVREHLRTLYAERNCYVRKPRYPGGSSPKLEPMYSQPPGQGAPGDPYQLPDSTRPLSGPPLRPDSAYGSTFRPSEGSGALSISDVETGSTLGLGCEPHQYTFERTFGYDFRLAPKERASIAPTVGIAIGCQQECLKRGDRCQSFVVEYSLPFQSCFLIETQVGANKKLLFKAPNSAYFEKVCLTRPGIGAEALTHGQLLSGNQADAHSMDIAPSYSSEPWSPQVPNQLPYYLQQQQLVQNYPSRTCAKLWTFERFVNHNFTAESDKVLNNVLSKGNCETHCLNEANFNCRAATYDYNNKICRLFKNTRRTIMSQFIDLESPTAATSIAPAITSVLPNSQPGSAHILTGDSDTIHTADSNVVGSEPKRRQGAARQLSLSAEPSVASKNIDYLENTCIAEPSSCQYRQIYDSVSPFVDKINHAVSLSDCQRQCDLERLFSCKSINYDPTSRNCMLINEDLISLNRGQQAVLIPKKHTIYSEKGNCEMISVQCNSQEMLVSINFDSPFRGRVMAKGNPEQCFLLGDGQTSVQFPIVFGPKCNSRQEGHNTFVNEVVIQQHPVIMTDNDKTVRVMCAFEAPDQTITLKNPTSQDNKTGIDVGTPESGRTRHDKQHFNSVVSNKAAPPSVLLRILDQNGRDASMINLGDDLILRIQIQMDGQNSALGIFARNLAARSSNGESLLLIDNDGCPVDPQVFPSLEVDPKDGKSLVSTFKAFRFPSSGLVNFEVQIRFCPERCQPIDCHRGQKSRSYGRRKRQISLEDDSISSRTSIISSVSSNQDQRSPLEALSTVMKPGKAFQYVRELMLATSQSSESNTDSEPTREPHEEMPVANSDQDNSPQLADQPTENISSNTKSENLEPENLDQSSREASKQKSTNDFIVGENDSNNDRINDVRGAPNNVDSTVPSTFQKTILMHVDEKVVPSTNYVHHRGLNQPHSLAPYGRFPFPETDPPLQNSPTTSTASYNNNEQLSMTTAAMDSGITPNTLNIQPSEDSTLQPNDVKQQDSGRENHQNESQPDLTNTETPNSRRETSYQDTNQPTLNNVSPKDVPLRFSILVGENQALDNNWRPNGPASVLVMNSSNVDLDHIVIPGKDQHQATAFTGASLDQLNTNYAPTSHNSPSPNYNDANYNSLGASRSTSSQVPENAKGTNMYDQTFDALSSNSVAAEVKINHSPNFQSGPMDKSRQTGFLSDTAASHDCQVASGSNKIWTIIWTGTIVIILNICLVILSLVLYFKKVHLSKNHSIMRAASKCQTNSLSDRPRWPSVILKSKNNLGTSLNTHEHFFCKLNSKPSGSSGLGGHEFNWPNLSSSSTHSTISSMASPLPVTSIRINQALSSCKMPFDSQSSLRNNFSTGHKSVLDANSYSCNGAHTLHASFTDNIDKTHPDTFER